MIPDEGILLLVISTQRERRGRSKNRGFVSQMNKGRVLRWLMTNPVDGIWALRAALNDKNTIFTMSWESPHSRNVSNVWALRYDSPHVRTH